MFASKSRGKHLSMFTGPFLFHMGAMAGWILLLLTLLAIRLGR
jgi:hypothetical protein